MNKRVTFIGGGASSLCSAVLLKKNNPSLDVVIVEKEKKLGKKLSATGGGKCNIAPLKDDVNVYNLESRELVKKLFDDIPLDKYLANLKQIGVVTKIIKDYGYYPVHESAPQLVKNLYHQINKLGIKVIYDDFLNYIEEKTIKVVLTYEQFDTDYLVLATGGINELVNPSFIKMLGLHNVPVTKTYPGLCPLKLNGTPSDLLGCRFEAYVSLKKNGQEINHYSGEIQFKRDGVSGMPILNLSSELSRDLVNGNSEDYVLEIGLPFEVDLSSFIGMTFEEALLSNFKESYVNYLLFANNINRKEIVSNNNIDTLSNLLYRQSFSINSLYDYQEAQVSVGGVDLSAINDDFSLKTNPNIFIVGEALNVDGICGGYNLRFAITSGFKVATTIAKKL